MTHISRLLGAAALVSLAACNRDAIARSDSLQLAISEQQTRHTELQTQLQAQKDSLTRVVLDADMFIGQMDSAISTVRGLPRSRRTASENPLADQIVARKEMMSRVEALVARAKTTASQLAELQRKQAASDSATRELESRIAQDAQMIADLGATIERQRTMIAALEMQADSLGREVKSLGDRHYRAYYVIGTEKELVATGVAVKEGGANLLIARPGKTLVPARVLNADAFSTIDQRQVTEIQVPDTTRRYKLVSRQSLDAAEVVERDGLTFKGNLKITKPEEFWASSRFLILVEM